MALDPAEQAAKQGRQRNGEERDGRHGDGPPKNCGVPLPEPKLAAESQGILMGGAE